VANRVGRRGAALLFFALLDFVYCYGLLSRAPAVDAVLRLDERHHAAALWAACWGVVGVICLVFAFRDVRHPGVHGGGRVEGGVGAAAAVRLAGRQRRAAATCRRSSGWRSPAFVFLIAGGIPAAPPRAGEEVAPVDPFLGNALTVFGVLASAYLTYRVSRTAS
jgi:hypothetical protein